MNRKLALCSAIVVVLAAAIALATPYAVRRYAESKVDGALNLIGYQTTARVERGDVSVDVWSWTVSAKNVSITGASGASAVHIAKISISEPSDAAGQMTAARMVLDEVRVTAPGETISIPRAEIRAYDGPKKGLTATPGLGREPVTQADLFEQLSIERLVAPVVVFAGEHAPLKRTIRNLVVSNMRGGVIEAATADAITFEGAYLPPETAGPASLLISTGRVTYQGLSLPALWRFYDGNPGEDRQPLVKSIKISDITASLGLRPAGRMTASIEKLQVDGVALRPLGFSIAAFDPIATRMKMGTDATPQEVREQISFAVGLSRAIAFERISAVNGRTEVLSGGKPQATASFATAEVGPYADARIEAVTIDKAAFSRVDGVTFALAAGKAFGFNATGLVDYADRVARDEILLTTKPTADEIIKIAPRLNSVDAEGFELSDAQGKVKADRTRIDIDAPLDAVPQRVTFKLDGLFASPPPGTRVQDFIERLELDRIKGSAKFSLTLNPTDKTLSLDGLDYNLEQLGAVTATGKLNAVDPVLAVATGADFVDKFSAIELAPFKITLNDDGAVAVLLRRAAEKAGQPPESYREQIARETQDTIVRLLGPSTEPSAKAASDFIKDPRAIEITLSPRTRGQTLLELMRAYDLGLTGLAQVVEVEALYRR